MKKTTKVLLALGMAFGIAVTTARGQFNTVSVNELGNGFYNGAVVGSGSIPDPFNGGIPHFAYILPFTYSYLSPVADIHLSEPGSTQPSDLLRFTRDASGLNTILFFYSDASIPGDAPDAPADVLALPNPVNLVFSFVETGLFGNPYTEAGPNGFVYTANPGMPGEDGSGVPLQYTFISDTAAPEPGSLALLAGGLGILGGLKLLRRKALSQRAQSVSPDDELTTTK